MIPSIPPEQGQVPDIGHPFLDWAFEYLMVWGLVALTLLGLWAKLKPYLVGISRDVAVTREQTENSHASAQYPNLRDNIDANHAEYRENHVEVIAVMGRLESRLARLEADNERQEKDLGGMRAEAREDRREHNRLAERVTHLEAGREPGYRRAPGFHRKTPTEEEDTPLTF